MTPSNQNNVGLYSGLIEKALRRRSRGMHIWFDSSIGEVLRKFGNEYHWCKISASENFWGATFSDLQVHQNPTF